MRRRWAILAHRAEFRRPLQQPALAVRPHLVGRRMLAETVDCLTRHVGGPGGALVAAPPHWARARWRSRPRSRPAASDAPCCFSRQKYLGRNASVPRQGIEFLRAERLFLDFRFL
jgi:hypothetical protein